MGAMRKLFSYHSNISDMKHNYNNMSFNYVTSDKSKDAKKCQKLSI